MSLPPRPTTGAQGEAWWDARYASRQTGWDRPGHARHVEIIHRLGIQPCRALDLGCGRGRNSRYLAGQGFSVVGIDISGLAIAEARAKVGDLDCSFHRLDVLNDPIPGGPFQLVFDYGCFHVFDEDEHRARLVARVAAQLSPDALWVGMVGSTDGPPRDQGPPRRSALDIVRAVEPHFEILELNRGLLASDDDPIRPTWDVVFRKRSA